MGQASTPDYPPLLPPGFHPHDLQALHARCVTGFPLSSTRPGIMWGLELVVTRLEVATVPGELWVDGSFLTGKIDPQDADMVLRLTGDEVAGLLPDQEAALDWFTDPARKSDQSCDTYLFAEYPAGHARQGEGEWMRAYWIRQFGFSRETHMKGIAVVRLGGSSP